MDPVSTAKAVKVAPVLGALHAQAQPHRGGASLRRPHRRRQESGRLRRRSARHGAAPGLSSAWGDGVYAADHLGGHQKVPCVPARMVNTTGCGDAFMAALAWGWLEGLGLEEAARAGLAASAIAMEGTETINPELTAAAVRARAGL
ncbi:MAG: PfkB family carbohydrate kinase [Intestinimonas sp.]